MDVLRKMALTSYTRFECSEIHERICFVFGFGKAYSHKISCHSDRVENLSATFEFWGDLEFLRRDGKT